MNIKVNNFMIGVSFNEYEDEFTKLYYYLCDEEVYVGDKATVSTRNGIKTVIVRKVINCHDKNLPYPINRCKKVEKIIPGISPDPNSKEVLRKINSIENFDSKFKKYRIEQCGGKDPLNFSHVPQGFFLCGWMVNNIELFWRKKFLKEVYDIDWISPDCWSAYRKNK